MIFETAEMHMKKAYVKNNVVQPTSSENEQKIEVQPFTAEQLEAVNAQFTIAGHLQKFRAIK